MRNIRLQALGGPPSTLPSSLMTSFRPNEANAIWYDRDRGSYLAPHCDDRQLSGRILCNLCLAGDAVMVYSRDKKSGGKSCLSIGWRMNLMLILCGLVLVNACSYSVRWESTGFERDVRCSVTPPCFADPSRDSALRIPAFHTKRQPAGCKTRQHNLPAKRICQPRIFVLAMHTSIKLFFKW
jgi:hypothetical protein